VIRSTGELLFSSKPEPGGYSERFSSPVKYRSETSKKSFNSTLQFQQLHRYVRVGYLVDPASSHMLVSKIKPCMSKHKPKYGKAANGSLQQL
jgi:hypothetical protein